MKIIFILVVLPLACAEIANKKVETEKANPCLDIEAAFKNITEPGESVRLFNKIFNLNIFS